MLDVYVLGIVVDELMNELAVLFRNVVSRVSTLDEFSSPEPSRELNVFPPSVRLVVEAVVNDAYVVDDRANLLTPENEFVSVSNVEDAAPASDVKNPASLLNHDSLIDDEAIVLTSPLLPVYVKPCVRDGRYTDDPSVDEAVEKKPPVRPSVVDVEL